MRCLSGFNCSALNFEINFYLQAIIFDTSGSNCESHAIKLCFSSMCCVICSLFNKYAEFIIFTICFTCRRPQYAKNKLMNYLNVYIKCQTERNIKKNLILIFLSKTTPLFLKRVLLTTSSMPLNVKQWRAEICCYNKSSHCMKQLYIPHSLKS